MKDPVFAQTRHHYDSYSDFWNLVSLSGYRTVWLDEIDLGKEEIYITTPFSGETVEALLGKERKAKVIWWNLERPDHDIPKDGIEAGMRLTVTRTLASVDHVWSYDPTVATMDKRLVFAHVGSHPGLYQPGNVSEYYDLCHLSYLWGRREDMIAELSKAFRIAPAAWGEKRASILEGSRAILNLHQREPLKINAPLRFAIAAAYGVPIFSETIDDPWPLVPGESMMMAGFPELPSMVPEWLAHPNLFKIGETGMKLLTRDHTFRLGVEDALRRTL